MPSFAAAASLRPYRSNVELRCNEGGAVVGVVQIDVSAGLACASWRAIQSPVHRMKFISQYPECQRLWHAYSGATTEHVSLEGKLQIGALSRASDTIRNLMLQVEDAAAKPSAARDAIHEATA